jgi:hypothetical protein
VGRSGLMESMNLSRFILSAALYSTACCLPAFSQQEVVVANPPKAPALVQQAPAEPFVKSVSVGPTSAPNVHSLFTVPAKKRLVIETVTVIYRGGTQSNHVIHGALLHALNGPSQLTFHLPVNRSDYSPNAVPTLPGAVMIAQSLANVRWYVQGGQSLQLEVLASGTFSYVANLTFSGYLVDMP